MDAKKTCFVVTHRSEQNGHGERRQKLSQHIRHIESVSRLTEAGNWKHGFVHVHIFGGRAACAGPGRACSATFFCRKCARLSLADAAPLPSNFNLPDFVFAKFCYLSVILSNVADNGWLVPCKGGLSALVATLQW